MAVVFEAKIKVDDTENWYIELSDVTVPDEIKVESCLNLDELETKIEEFGAEYGGHVDEVKWLKDDNVLPFVMDDVRAKMAEHRAKLEETTGEPITPVATKKDD
jgi:hypothetical protein